MFFHTVLVLAVRIHSPKTAFFCPMYLVSVAFLFEDLLPIFGFRYLGDGDFWKLDTCNVNIHEAQIKGWPEWNHLDDEFEYESSKS